MVSDKGIDKGNTALTSKGENYRSIVTYFQHNSRKMKRSIFKQIARYILRKELRAELAKRRELHQMYLQTNEFYKHQRDENFKTWKELQDKKRIKTTLPDYMLCAIIQNLPNPSDFANGGITASDLYNGKPFNMEWKGRFDKYPRTTSCRFSRVAENGIEVELLDLGAKIFIPLHKWIGSYNMMGVDTEINTWAWNFNEIGLAVISSGTFDRIAMFMEAQKNVLTSFQY